MASIDELYERYYPLMFERAFAVLRNSQDAQDVVQDIFLSIWARKDELVIETTIKAYLLVAVKYRCLAFIRDNLATRRDLLPVVAALDTAITEDHSLHLEARETGQQIDNAIRQMPDKMRVIFHMSRENDLSHRQIAAQLNIEEGTVKKQIQYALRRIRNKIVSLVL